MKAFGTCTKCGARIELRERKDFESYTMREMQIHYKIEHPELLTDFGIPFTPIEFVP